jgi:hypothetical protein
MPRLASLSSKGLTNIGVGTAVVAPSIPTWVAATKGFPTTSIDVFSVTNGQLASSSSTLYSPLEANSVNDQFAISPENNFVYVPNGTKNRIEIIPVDPDTGIYTGSGVTSVSTTALGTYPSNITISPDGSYAYVLFSNSFKVGIYSRNALTGALTGISNLRDGYAFAKITSDGAYLYTVLNNLIIYSRDISTGALTLIAEDTQAVTNGGFAKITISSDNRSLYVADFAQNNFYCYTIDPATGLITLDQTINLSSFGADVRSNGVEVSNDGNYVYVTLYDINQVLGTTVVMYSRSPTAPFTLTQSNVYTITGAVGEQTSNLILTKQQNLLIMSVSGSSGAPIHSWTRNTLNGRLTLNADVTGFGNGIATNTGTLPIPIPFQPVFTARVFPTDLYNAITDYDAANNRMIINSANAIYSSSSGTSWTAGTYPTTSNQSFFMRVLGDGNYVAGHTGGVILRSTLGTSSYTANTTGLPANARYNDFAKSGSTFIVASSYGIHTSTSISSTYTLRSNTATTVNFARNPNTGRLFAWGLTGSNAILQSSDNDGVTWTTRLTITQSQVNVNQFAGIAWFAAGNCLIASQGWFKGVGLGATGAIYKIAADGTSYTQVFTEPTSNYLTSVGVDTTNGQAYVSGFGGKLYRSLNGDNWVSQTTNTSANLAAITWMPNVNRLVVQGYQNTTYITSQ